MVKTNKPRAPKKKAAPAKTAGFADRDGYALAVGDQVRYTSPTSPHSGGLGTVLAIHDEPGREVAVATVELTKLDTWKEAPRVPAPSAALTFEGRPAFAVGERARVEWENTDNYGSRDHAYTGREGLIVSICPNPPFADLVKLDFAPLPLDSVEFAATDLLRTALAEPVPVEPETDLPMLGDSVKPEALLTWEASDVLLRIREAGHLGALQPPKVTAAKTELFELGLIRFRQEDGAAVLTEAGTQWLADYDAIELPPSPVDEALNAHAVGLRVLPLASITVTRNTRQVFDEAALAELAESIKAHGVLQPIVVRPAAEAGHYELVAGGRRHRAALAAGLAEIPATVRVLTDREFLEVQLLENLQRVDVRPADEAQAFAELLRNGFTVEEISAKVGKPARFVAERARLMELLPEWVDALQQGRLLIGSAQQLARLTRAQQSEAHQHLDSSYGDKVDVGGVMRRVYSAADIRQHLDRNYRTHDLDAAAFPKDDADLYPVAGACVTCPKRTGNTLYLFDDLGGNKCLDGGCFTEKSTRYVARVEATLAADGQPVLKVADHWGRVPADVLNLNKHASADRKPEAELQKLREAGRVRPALMTEGPRAGQIVEVVLDEAVAKQPDVVAAIKEERAKQTQKEKDDAAKVRALGAARRQAYFQLTADVHGDGLYTAVLLRRMLYKKLEYRSYGSLRELLQKVYGWEGFKGGSYLDERERKLVVGRLAAMEAPQLQGLLLDIQLLEWLEEEHPSNLPALCKELKWSDEQLLAAHAERKKGKKQEATA